MSVALFGLGSAATAYALDGTRSPANIAPAVGGVAPQGRVLKSLEEALRAFGEGFPNLRASFAARQLGDFEAARKLLEGAARDGDVLAAWALGRMYAEGDGVKQSHQLAFEYFGALPIPMPMNRPAASRHTSSPTPL